MMRTKWMRALMGLIAMLLLAVAPVCAQQGAGATVRGVVRDTTGAAVAGATVRVEDTRGTGQETATTADGSFEMTVASGGRVSVTVSAKGFATATVKVEVSVGRVTEVAAVTLRVATATEQVNAQTEEQIADRQIHSEEQQRTLGVLPNFYVAYDPNAVPLHTQQKYKMATRSALDPMRFVMAGVRAGIEQAQDTPNEWGQDMPGYGQRYGAAMGGTVAEVFLERAVLPSVFHQDPRYFYKGKGTKKERLGYALRCSVTQKSDKGKWQPAYSNLIGGVSGGLATAAFYPPGDTDWGPYAAESAGITVGALAMRNVLQEFVFSHVTTHRKQNASAGTRAGN
jgi:hypothetical protein